MPACAVHGCNVQSKTPNYTFYPVPRALIPRMIWLEAIKWPLDTTENLHVCSRHFEESAFMARGSTKLVREAVPTIFSAYVKEIPQKPSTPPPAPDSRVYLEKVTYLQDKLSQTMRTINKLKKKVPPAELQRPKPKPNGTPVESSDDLPACRVCLATDVPLFKAWQSRVLTTFEKLSEAPLSAEGLPRRMCALCRNQLVRCAEFRERCQRSLSLLQTLLEWGPLTLDDIKSVDRDSHQLTKSLHRPKPRDKQDNPVFEIVTPMATQDDENGTSNFTEVDGFGNDDLIESDSDDGQRKKVEKEQVKLADKKSKKLLETGDRVEIIPNGTNTKIRRKRKMATLGDKAPTKTTKLQTRNTEYWFRLKRKKIGDEFYPNFNYEAFERDCNVKIKFLTKEEQRQEVEDIKRANKEKPCCQICGKPFSFEHAMKKHMMLHDPNYGSHECEICHRRYQRRGQMSWHRNLHRLLFTCQRCGHVSRHRRNARLHFYMHQGKTYTCPHCEEVYHQKSSYLTHVRVKHPGMNVACDQCGETFLSALGVRLHKGLAHRPSAEPTTEYKCSDCDVAFLGSEALDKHKEAARGVLHAALWPCAACGESCGSDAARAQHQDEWHPPDQHWCEECSQMFASAASFDTHVRRKHMNVARSGRTPRRCRQRSSSRTPRRSAPLRSALVCEMCGKLVASAARLRAHQRSHAALKPYACPECPKTFAAPLNRELHMRVHKGERPFQCDGCGLAFSVKGNLARHFQVVHLNMRLSFPCHLCHKTFTTRGCVKTHIRDVHINMPRPKRVRRKKTADADK